MTSAIVFTSIGSTLVHCSVDTGSGALAEVARIELPSLIEEGARHPQLPLLYVACTDREGGPNVVVTVAFGEGVPARVVGTPAPLPARAVHLTIAPDGDLVVATHTGAIGASVLPVDDEGRLGTVMADSVIGDVGVYMHDTEFLPGGDRAILVARGQTGRTGAAAVAGRLDLAAVDSGRLRIIDSLDLSPDLGAVGFNPRNVAPHPTLPVLYVTLEAQNLLVVVRRDGDRLVPVPEWTRSLLEFPEEARARQLGGVVHVHPDGRSLIAVTRADGPIIENDRWKSPEPPPVFEGGENTISVFHLDAHGAPALVQRVDTGGISARCVEFVDGGRLVVAANSKPILRAGPDGPVSIHASLAVFRAEVQGGLRGLSTQPFEVGRATLWWLG